MADPQGTPTGANNPNLMLEFMATLGGSMNPEGPAGAMGGMANQLIQNQSYMNMMKKMMGDRNLQSQNLQNMTLADTAGLTPAMMSNIMKTMLGQRDISRKSLADVSDAAYKSAQVSNWGRQAETREAQVGIQQGQLDARRTADYRKSILDFKKLSNQEKTGLIKEYEFQKSQGGKQSFNDWYAWRVEQNKSGVGEKTPGLLSYGQARSSLKSRYSEMNPTGQFIITPGLEAANAYAMERFANYSKQGLSPGDAENRAYRDTQNYQVKSERMLNILRSQGRENEIPAMLKNLRRYR